MRGVTFRTHALTGEPILFAPGRAARPRAFDGVEEVLERCPFCPGHEADTPPEIARIGGEAWRARVFPNKYPPTDGAEVIVESPAHEATFDGIEHADEVVALTIDRYRAHADAPYTAIFKNEGPRAGSSIPHVHSQIVPLPFVPPRIARESAGFANGCPLCAMRGHVIRETRAFVWLAPHASAMTYQQWIVPKEHRSEWSGADAGELAQLLRSASAAMLRMSDAYNWMFINFPRVPRAHAYIDLFPRVTTIAGLELGTGTFVEIIDPADAARRLRNDE